MAGAGGILRWHLGVRAAAMAGFRRQHVEEGERRARFAEIARILRPFQGESPEVVEQALNRGERLANHRESIDYFGKSTFGDLPGSRLGPQYEGYIVSLQFWKGKLLQAHTNAPPYRPSDWPRRTIVKVGRFVYSLTFWAGTAWAVAMLTIPFARQWRRGIAHFALAAVLLALFAWAAEPFKLWGWWMVRQPVPIGIASVLLFTVVVLLWPRGKARRAEPKCRECGYNLTGNESGICPECGTPTPVKQREERLHRWDDAAHAMEEVAAGVPGTKDLAGPADREAEDACSETRIWMPALR